MRSLSSDALLVLGRHGDHADGGKAAVQPVVRKEVQLDAANVHRVVGGALRVRGRDAGHTLDRFGIALLRSLLELFSRGDRLGHRQRLLVAELLLVVLGLRHFLRARRRIRAVEGGEAHGLALDLITDLLRLADERILAGGVAREDDGDRAHGVARRIAHRQLHFKARPVGAQRGLLRGRANDLQVARVRFLADAPDVGGDDRIVGACRILDVQDRDEDRGLPRQRVVHEVLRIGVYRGLRVVLRGRHEVLGAVGDAPAQPVANLLGLLHQRFLVGAGHVRERHLDRAHRAPRDVLQLHGDFDIVVAGLVDLDARLTRLEDRQVVGIGALAHAVAALRGDDHALGPVRRNGVDVELDQLRVARGRAVDEVLGVVLASGDRAHGFLDVGPGLGQGFQRGAGDCGHQEALGQRDSGQRQSGSFHGSDSPEVECFSIARDGKVRGVPEGTLTASLICFQAILPQCGLALAP